jgi:nucleoside-diphosphate-sugar epimerase
MHKILVTGGAGFLGSHLCERLVGEATLAYFRKTLAA